MRKFTLFGTAGMLAAATAAQAAIVANHLGSADPETEGWSPTNGINVGGTNVTGTPSAFGPSWYIDDANNDGGDNNARGGYFKDLTSVEMPTGSAFALTVTMAMGASQSQVVNQFVEVDDGISLWQINFRANNRMYRLQEDFSRISIPELTTFPSGEFRTVVLTLDIGANAGDPADDTMTIFDGTDSIVLDRTMAPEVLSNDAYIQWGTGNKAEVSDAYWNQVTLDVVPEPASLSLIGLAGLVLRRRR